jgi:tetratricopeptide (TPR) repeat protein
VERQRLPQLLDEARQAITRGDFITPPGSSAWDKLRVASAIAPDSSQVLALQKEFSQRSRACFEQAMTGNQLKRAQTCLEANLSLEPYSAAANDARHRLADRWLAYAEERIAASDYPEAEMALAFARQWQPTHPKLKVTMARLQRARGSSP